LYLANSNDLSLIGELSGAQDKNLSVGLNKSGSFGFNLNCLDDLADDIDPITKCVIGYKNGVAKWSGPIWTVDDELPSNRIQVNAVGWFEKLNKRLLSEDISFTDIDAGVIAVSLLNQENIVGNTLISPGVIQSSQTRTRAYKEHQNLGQEIQSLSQIEAGFDWEVTPDSRLLNIYNAKRIDRPEIVFGYRWGPHNIQSLKRTQDGDRLFNHVVALGQGGNQGESSNTVSINKYGIFEQTISATELTESALLAAYAAAEVTFLSEPLELYQITPLPYIVGSDNNYSIFEDYDLGDIVYLVAKHGRVDTGDTPLALRIFGADISFDKDGVERITSLKTTASG
jgi:hypothetical protein